MHTPDLFERIMERLMRWHDPDADARREARYDETRRRSIAIRKRAEAVIQSYESADRAIRGRAHQ